MIIASGGMVAAINPETGNIKWETTLKGKSRLQGDVSLMIEKDVIFAGCMGHLFCLDKHNGNIKWHNGLKGWGYGSVLIGFKDKLAGASGFTNGSVTTGTM